VDIVAEQFRIAAGEPLSWMAGSGDDAPLDPVASGHAFEFRINAEDVANGFVPCPGTVTAFEVPTGPGIRVDAGVVAGSEVPRFYDSMLGKLIVWGPTREVALSRARAALDEFRIEGVRTVLPFHRSIVREPALTAVGAGAPVGTPGSADAFGMYTDWVDTRWSPDAAVDNGTIEDVYLERTELSVEIDGRLHRVGLPTGLLGAVGGGAAASAVGSGAGSAGAGDAVASGPAGSATAGGTTIPAPFAGTVVEWKVADGTQVSEGDTVATVEAMKMERAVTTPAGGVLHIIAEAGASVTAKQPLGRVE
jgi:acetyl-CoA/propionyl-CoA carboxylase biotin carboxyl carrier protein